MTGRQIAIVLNDSPTTDPCALCSRETFTPAGARLVLLDDSPAPVCDDCGLECAPELLSLIKLGEAALLFGAMQDFTPRYTFASPVEKVH